MEELRKSQLKRPILDGGNYGDTKMVSSSTRKERSLMSHTQKIRKVQLSLLGASREATSDTNNGTSSMLTNGRDHQRRENSMRTSDSMLKDHSTLFPN